MPPQSSCKQLLLIGAFRGLGFALGEEYLKRGWHVTALHALDGALVSARH
jgi:NAD(P)-dependent dehydrogenase (short-subunit alcohol dehydrogenase family)